MANLTESDRREIGFLFSKADTLPPRPGYAIPRKRILDAILNGEAERTGIATCNKIREGKLGVLERENGYVNGTYSRRVFAYCGMLYDLDELLWLEPKGNYSFLEKG